VMGKTVLLYAGAIGEPQGLDFLVDTCKRLRDEPTFHCIVAGSGVAEPRLRAKAETEGLGNLSFLGRWPITDMTRLMSIGDIHLVSLRADALAVVAMPSKLAATLACAKPVIVAALGDAAGVVQRANAGWTCSPGNVDQLEACVRAALAASPITLQAMGDRGRTAYEAEFAVGTAVNRVERLLMGTPIEDKHVA
ncbi:MAG TPA: glycosyltransferase, partial [Edaphobacter sp.]